MFQRLVLFFKSNDWVLTLSILLLLLVGLSALYGSGKTSDEGYQNFLRQGLFAAAGFVVYIFFANIDYRRLRSLGGLLYVLAILFLLAVLFFGTTIRNTTGWFRIGSIGIQPIELVKVLWILVMAGFLVSRGQRMSEWKNIGIFGALMLGIVGLTMLQPDLGSALVVIGTTVVILLITNIKMARIILIGFLIVALLVSGWFWFLQDYQIKRIKVIFNPSLDPLGAGYHVTQSIIAIGSGGWFGRGLGYGSQSQLQFLPEQQTDFIFAVIAEELGFVGAGLVILLFGLLLYRCVRIAVKSRDPFGTFVVYGVMLMVFFHVVINIGMNVGLFPVAGIPLPFVSAGGSSLLAMMIAFGIVQSVAIQVRNSETTARP